MKCQALALFLVLSASGLAYAQRAGGGGGATMGSMGGMGAVGGMPGMTMGNTGGAMGGGMTGGGMSGGFGGNTGGFGSSGGFGSNTGGLGNAGGFGTGSGFGTGGMSQFGQSGGMSGGMGGMSGGMGGMSGGMGGMSGMGAAMPAGFGNFSPFGSALGAAAMGRSSMGMGGMGMGSMGMGGMGGMSGRSSRGGRGANQFGNNQSQNKSQVRATIKLGFAAPQPAANQRATEIQTRVSRIPIPARLNRVRYTIEGRTAVLQGAVDSPADAQMLQRLLSLEPGIDDVRSELVVTPQS